MDRIKEYMIHFLGGKTAKEYKELQAYCDRVKKTRYSEGVGSTVASFYTVARNSANLKDKEWRATVGSYIVQCFDKVVRNMDGKVLEL